MAYSPWPVIHAERMALADDLAGVNLVGGGVTGLPSRMHEGSAVA